MRERGEERAGVEERMEDLVDVGVRMGCMLRRGGMVDGAAFRVRVVGAGCQSERVVGDRAFRVRVVGTELSG